MKDFSKIISITTAYLLALGFISNYGFYSHFNIEIFTYLNSAEIILSFIPLLIPILVAVVIIIYYSLNERDKFEIEKKNNPFISNKDLSFWGPFKDLIRLIKNKFKTDDKVGKTIYHYVVQIFSRLLILIFLLGSTLFYIIAFVKKLGFPYDSPVMFFIISIIWLAIIVHRGQKYFHSRFKEVSNYMAIVILLLGFLVIVYLFNSFKAFRILDNKPLYDLELRTRDTIIKTNDNLVYIGKTKEYYFLRDLKSSENLIISVRIIDEAKFSHIKDN